MKMYGFIFSLLLLAGFFVSCQHDGVYDPDLNKGMTDLVVPQDFDWEMSGNVTLSLTSPVQTTVNVFAEEACQTLLATVPVSSEETAYNLSVNKKAGEIYVQYSKADGTKAVLPVSFTSLPVRSNDGQNSWAAFGKLPEDDGAILPDAEGNMTLYYPSAGWGTLLFEDMWPEKGDYDFNDLTALYKIQLHELELTSKKRAGAIHIAVQLKALGGDMPYKLCLQILGVKANNIEEIEGGNGSWQLENPGSSENAIFSFNWEGKKGSLGGKYYNTEKDFPASSEELQKNIIDFMIYLKNPVGIDTAESTLAWRRKIKHESFDFYLRKEDADHTEIHLKGYEPTQGFLLKYIQIVRKNDIISGRWYATKDNFVWGMKVDKKISHAVEKISFIKAYPQFADWVQSDGENCMDWYTSKVSVNCME